VPNFLSVTWSEETFHGLGILDVESLVLVDVLFPLDGRRREGKKKGEGKKSLWGRRVYPPGWTVLLAAQWVADVRCN
jgi:hypothetical protein